MVRFLLLTVLLCGTAVLCSEDWTKIQSTGSEFDLGSWDLETTPIQIKTDSELGSDEQIELDMYTDNGDTINNIIIKWPSSSSDKVQFAVGSCTDYGSTIDLTTQPSADVDKIWTITKTNIYLIITCNNQTVLEYNFYAGVYGGCLTSWKGDSVGQIKLSADDSASDYYRAAPACPTLSIEGSSQGNYTSVTSVPMYIYCANGYNLYGSNMLTCQQDGTWDSDAPECIAECTEFEVEGSKQGNWTVYEAGATVTVECNDYHSMNGSATLTCQENGTWSSDVPSCVAPVCPEFAVEGTTKGNWTEEAVGTTMTIECAPSHNLYGNAVLTCQEDGSWSSDAPECVAECPEFEVEGSKQGNWTAEEVGTTFTVECNDYHTMNGSAILTCQENGLWSSDVPLCIAPTCPEFEVDESIEGNYTEEAVGTIVSIECVANYTIVGSANLTCQEDGSWSSDIPECVEVSSATTTFGPSIAILVWISSLVYFMNIAF